MHWFLKGKACSMFTAKFCVFAIRLDLLGYFIRLLNVKCCSTWPKLILANPKLHKNESGEEAQTIKPILKSIEESKPIDGNPTTQTIYCRCKQIEQPVKNI